MKKYITYIFLGLILLVAIATRFYKLGEAPAGLYVDEAGQGYSAYSILKTGKDEFGKPFPIVFRSFTDFKTPVYIYMIVPLIPVFGLSAFTVRFPSFFFSILTIPVLFLLIKHLTRDEKISLLACLLLAISPWHILFGRTNFECNVALFFFLTGVLSFFASLKKPWLLLISATMFAIAIPAYHSQRIITPLMLIILFFRYRKVILDKAHKSLFFIGLAIGLLISLPTFSVALTPGFLARASGLNIFSHVRQMPDGFIAGYRGMLSPIANGSWFLSTREFLFLYFSYFSPRNMFILGDYGPRSSFPELSTFFLWQFPFYLYGLWVLIKGKIRKEFRFFVISLLLISPIPAAVTRDPYTTIRALPLVIPQILIISLGIQNIFLKIKDHLFQIIYMAIFILLTIYSLFKLYSSVIILNEYYRAKAWDYGWEGVSKVIENLHTSLPIVVDNVRNDSYIQLAFFLKYDPAKFQQENFEVPLSQYYTNLYRKPDKRLGNIVTRPINWQNDLPVDQYLIGDEFAISIQQIQEHHLTLVSEIKYPDGIPAFRIVKTNPEYEMKERRLYNLKYK